MRTSLRAPLALRGATWVIKRQFDVVVEKDSEGFFVASVPALSGCHTQARSLDELMERIKEAIELCLEVQEDDIEELDFVGVQRVTVYEGFG
jgi:predicted RNase H-like HicB family nuclease